MTDFAPFADRMHRAALPEAVIRTFRTYYDQLVAGRTGLIPEHAIRPVSSIPDLDALDPSFAAAGRSALHRTVLIKLNGGLGTGMGLERAKSLLVVKEGLTFLDVIARQALADGTPLVLMNSHATRADSLAALARYPQLQGAIPLDFVQNKVPKVLEADLSPAVWPQDPDLEWCPPGHGDVYTALATSGLLDALLSNGYDYAFISNADNLGAVLDERILGYLIENRLPLLMEVADRTAGDRKGGHLAHDAGDGRLILREFAQCPPEDLAAFQDIDRHRYFNTNSLWLDLGALAHLLDAQNGVIALPLIRNSKTLDPRDPDSPAVYQLETAMGAAIAVFEGAAALRVPRTRFAPVKKCDDLLAVRSDAYVVTHRWQLALAPGRTLGPLEVNLDPDFFTLIDDLEARFPDGPPSLIACERLEVIGDVKLGCGVVCRGAVRIVNTSVRQLVIPAGAVLEG